MSSWTNCTAFYPCICTTAALGQRSRADRCPPDPAVFPAVSPKLEQTGVFPSPPASLGHFVHDQVVKMWFYCCDFQLSAEAAWCIMGSVLRTLRNTSSQKHKHPALTLVTATLAPLFISWTTLSACPLCDATRRCSESVRTSAASSWLMKQRSRCWNSQTGARGHTEAYHSAELWPSCCRKQHRHLSSAANFKDDFPPSSAATDKRRNTCSENRSGWNKQEGKEQV